MPSTNFENSAMKSSFSLSSLPISGTPEKYATKQREYNSLKKKRKESTKRLSWGSSASEHKDEFWTAAIEANYNFIMDNQLIDNCQDANFELSADSMREFVAQFSDLYSCLNRIQEEIYGHEDNVTDKTLRARCKTEIIKKTPFYNMFNEQGNQLIALNPENKEDITWRLNHLNSKWETLESVLKSSDSEEDDNIDIQREVKCLKVWIRDMEERLLPLSFQKRWSPTEIETKATEHKVLHKDIQNHGNIVISVVKLCKRTPNSCRTTLNIVTGLERRWHLLVLRSMEWQCYIENCIKRNSNSALFSDSDSDEGPVKKQPRLSTASPPIFRECPTSDAHLKNAIDTPDGTVYGTNDNEIMNTKETEVKAITGVTGEDAQFTKSNRNAPNLGTYYFKHVDTDSDMEKLQNIALENETNTTTSETSEEEWTYTPNKNDSAKTPATPQSKKKLEIQKIFKEVEEMVSPARSIPAQPPMNKAMRIREWLEIEKPGDSCDASSEDEDNESESSEDLSESIATYRAQTSLNTSFVDLDVEVSTPKNTIRQRYNNKGIKAQRPSSISCITQLSKSSTRIGHDRQAYSISESALNKLPFTSNNMNASIGNNSTSSTVEDSCAMMNEHNSPLRRKRLKLKKKSSSILRKIEITSPYNKGTLIKSGSFSGRACIPTPCDRHAVSEPSAIPLGHGFETSTTSGADSDEDKRAKRMPVFKLGAKTNYNLAEIRDNSPGKFSMNTNEEPSSLCDEAWDSYQEKYSSEAYSEAHDSDAARRLLDFGEDYRTYLGSQSDWSTQSSQVEFSPQFPRKAAFLPLKPIDSDNEADNLTQLLKDSRNQLHYTEGMFNQQFSLGQKQYLVNNDVKELAATCERHINSLSPVQKSPEEYKLSAADKKEFSDLILSWQNLKHRIVKMQEYRMLQNEILQLKKQLVEINMPAANTIVVNSVEDLTRDIDFYSAELANIDDHKKKLLKVNVAVNHFMTENTEYNASSFKSDVSELYRVWTEINNSTQERINRLNVLLQNWQVLETRLDQLRGDLRGDEQTLGVLDSALQGGTFSNQMASSVRGVAKLLSETKTEGCSFPEIFTEGSFSDSGISDEGSEHDIGERERRLSAIRRLVRQLEIMMAPDCEARLHMRERLAAAEEELKTLQNKCRSIIVRTAVSAAAPLSESVVAGGPGGDPDEEPNTKSWFKRVVRASISFQFAIIALLFVACLLEPHCCDNMNNMQLSMIPQLHYVRGPPPV